MSDPNADAFDDSDPDMDAEIDAREAADARWIAENGE